MQVRNLGLQFYLPIWEAMKQFTISRDGSTEDEIWLLEHPPVYIQKNKNRYLVQTGPFASKEMVNELKQRLEQHDVHGSFSLLM